MILKNVLEYKYLYYPTLLDTAALKLIIMIFKNQCFMTRTSFRKCVIFSSSKKIAGLFLTFSTVVNQKLNIQLLHTSEKMIEIENWFFFLLFWVVSNPLIPLYIIKPWSSACIVFLLACNCYSCHFLPKKLLINIL